MAKSKETLFSKLRYEADKSPYSHKSGARYSLAVKIIIASVTVLICAVSLTFHLDSNVSEVTDYSIAPGNIWPGQTMVADFSFPVYKPHSKLEKEKKEARENTPKVFEYNEKAAKTVYAKLDRIIDNLKSADPGKTDIRTELYSKQAVNPLMNLNESQRKSKLSDIKNLIKNYLENTYRNGFIGISKEEIDNPEIKILLSDTDVTYFKKTNITDTSSFRENAKEFFDRNLSSRYQPLAMEISTRLMIPNLIYNKEQTQKDKELAAQSAPKTMGIVRKGETIIQKGDEVTETHIAMLNSYERSRFMKSDKLFTLWIFLGSIGHVILIYSILIIYLFVIRKRIFYDNVQFGVLSSLLVLLAIQAWVSMQVASSFPIEYLVFLPALSMLAAVVFDSRTAFYITVTIVFLLASIRGNDFETGTAMLIAGTFAAYTVRDIQSRTQMYKSFLFIFTGFSFTILFFALERSAEAYTVYSKLISAVINAALSPLLTFGLLFLLERYTNIATDLRIKEYDNLNHPLIVKLSENAPGTYQHTLSLAVTAERCANAIGANPLLARVGTYFHDIGKIERPEYFGENQMDFESKHDKMSPKKSAATIKAHVIKGIELAKEYKLPQRLIDFIPMHHGTTLIKHFYAKAVEEFGEENVNEEDFRYPGPKPKTKETAIVMICDTAEALSRAMGTDKEKFIKALGGSIEERILDEQFDDCNINFKELNIIQQTCVKNLSGLSHQRQPYKELPKKKQETQAAESLDHEEDVNPEEDEK